MTGKESHNKGAGKDQHTPKQHNASTGAAQDAEKRQETTVPEAHAPQVAEEVTREQQLTEHLQRLQAEFDNYRKRVEADAKAASDRGQDKLIKDLFVVADSLELARKHASASSKDESPQLKELRTALTLISNQFTNLFEQWGVQKVPADGTVDPRLHEVYSTETSEQPAGTILETFQHGYRRSGTVLRTAKVKAARKA